MSYQTKYQKYKLKYLSLKKQLGGDASSDYIQFVQSPECRDFFARINFNDLNNTSPEFIERLRSTLAKNHNGNPASHAEELTYFIDSIVTAMMPGSTFSAIPEDLKPIGMKYLKLLSALNPDTPANSIGNLIKSLSGDASTNYIQFVQSAECRDFFARINFNDLNNTSPEFIERLRSTLAKNHNDNPASHAEGLTYNIDAIVTGMMPGSTFSAIPEDLKPIGMRYLKLLSALNPGTPVGSIGNLINSM
jgi:hypothetical protein